MDAVARVEVEGFLETWRESEATPFHLLVILVRRPDFVLSTLVGALALALVYYALLLRETTIHTMIMKLGGEPVYLVLLALLALVALLLFGLNAATAALLIRTRAGTSSQGGSLLGVVIGGFGVGCPSCGAFLLSLVGVTAGLSALPFGGLELWVFSSLIMAFTFWRSLRSLQKTVCAAFPTGPSCVALPPSSPIQVRLLALAGLFVVSALAWAIAAHDAPSFAHLTW